MPDNKIIKAVKGFVKNYGMPTKNDIYELAYFWNVSEKKIIDIVKKVNSNNSI